MVSPAFTSAIDWVGSSWSEKREWFTSVNEDCSDSENKSANTKSFKSGAFLL